MRIRPSFFLCDGEVDVTARFRHNGEWCQLSMRRREGVYQLYARPYARPELRVRGYPGSRDRILCEGTLQEIVNRSNALIRGQDPNWPDDIVEGS